VDKKKERKIFEKVKHKYRNKKSLRLQEI